LLLHGRTEFIEKYYPTIERYRSMGFSVASFDWRGQGLSTRLLDDRLIGYCESFEDYLRDLDAAISWIQQIGSSDRFVLAAHSMGGCIAMQRLLRDPNPFHRAILSAPMLGLKMSSPVRWASSNIASMMCAFGMAERYISGARGGRTLADCGPEDSLLTSDEDNFWRFAGIVRKHPELGLSAPSWGWLRAAFEAMDEIGQAGQNALEIPTLMILPTEDRVVSNRTSQRFAKRQSAIEVFELHGSQHEPYVAAAEQQDALWERISAFLAS